MNITLIGAGNMGSGFVKQFTRAGHHVTVTARDLAKTKQTAQALAVSIGIASINAGNLKNARDLEPLGGLNIYFGYGAGQGTGIAPTWLHKA